ncbi:sialidase family protein [Acinetobacter variabilis]|uniref:sialidase family protein n=1 Tax=Acinetobacter variabilis TaxID=70346 RepID=UPI0028AA3840|nr:sialidase family protein [Acinetobacter variabilis]
MANQPVTKEKLINADIDADNLGKVANELGTVNPRYGNPYKTAPQVIQDLQQKADQVVAQGFYQGYATEALLLADKPAVAEMRARADDTRKIYRWNRTSAEGETPATGTWTDTGLSDVDQAKKYSDETKVSKEVVDNNRGQTQIVVLPDAEGNVVLNIAHDGRVYLAGENISLQDQLKVNQKIFNDPSPTIQSQQVDVNGEAINAQMSDGHLYLPIMKYSVQEEISRLRSISRVQSQILTLTHESLNNAGECLSYADSQLSELSNLDILAPFSDTNTIQRIASILKVDETTLLLVWGGAISGYNGDSEGVKLYKKRVKVNHDYTLTSLESRILIASPSVDSGVSKHPMLGKTTNGRIILVYDERDNVVETYRQYVRFSDDGGISFTEPVVIPHHPDLAGVVIALGSTGQILTTSTGRLLIPYYATGNICWVCYSDDNGTTWTHGRLLAGAGAEPTICFDQNDNILMSIRRDGVGAGKKLLARSTDNGETLDLIGFNEDLTSNSCASSLLYDDELGVILHGTPKLSLVSTAQRFKYQIQMSFDNGETFPVAFQPFDDEFYVGYSQIIKLKKGVYAVAVEGLTYAVGTNSKESAGVYIFNLKEAFQKCR